MPVSTLDKETVKSPQRSRLGLSLDRGTLHVLIKDSIADAPVYARFQLDMSLGSATKALEEIIYNNPVLLSDFAKVDVVLHSTDFVSVPDDIVKSGMEFSEAVVNASIADADSENSATFEAPVQGSGATIIANDDRDLINFIRRTFNNPTITHSLAVLAQYYITASTLGTAGKMYVNLHDDRLDIAIFGDEGLSLLNTFSYDDPMDAIYYIMATRSSLGIDQTSGELFLSGEASLRETITPTLRSYLGYVMPLVMPAQLIRAGAAAMEAPFDLTLLILCES